MTRAAKQRKGPTAAGAWRTALSLALLMGACTQSGESTDWETEQFPVVGGSLEYGYPLAGMLAADYGGGSLSAFCSASAVTPRVIISAAHCLDVFYELGGTPVVFAMMNPDGTGVTRRVNGSGRTTHPNWHYDYSADVGLIPLSEPIDAARFPMLRRSTVGSADIGSNLLLVGYGATHYSGGGTGTKRSIPMQVSEAMGSYYVMLTSPYSSGVCYGDSGGPSYAMGGDRDMQVGVHARTQLETCGPAEDTDVGHFFDSFIRPTVLSMDPTAENCGDGVCTGLEDDGTCPSDCGLYECGDGVIEDPEICDDGNLFDGDGCSSTCLSNEACGNGIVDGAVGEVCDDGNTAGGDGCSADCGSDETCGNGVVDAGVNEVCDDGNAASGDGCSADCRSTEVCGNGILDIAMGEVCDDGNAASGDGCSADCRSDETCGNGIVDAARGEVCDDGNAASGDGCSADCRVNEGCGNGVTEAALGEVCDDGNIMPGDGCSADCRSNETCGNGIIDYTVGEICDDGNTTGGDACEADCRSVEGCGNGVVNAERGEVCDDGNNIDGDGCSANCRSDETCGNGILDLAAFELCDDGNVLNGDTCPANCGARHDLIMPGGCACQAGGGGAAAPAASIILALALLFFFRRLRGRA
jgi:cysteine-rich repeat protein